ncbi:MAG: type I restriction-modification system subunit M [Candidatus Gastranaerophilales bacterium]|nr:type I restriction-modification system subunit M [Candidatus Gastranaerophilales bacterium]
MRKDTGVDGDAQRLSQIVWMLFLKIFADKEDEAEIIKDDYKSPLAEQYRWQNWAKDDEGLTGDELIDFINNDLFPYLQNLENPTNQQALIISNIFQDTYNYMKSGTLLRQVINKINEIDFNSSEDRHLFNDIYEQLLQSLQSAGNAGEYYTPRAVTQFIVDMVNPQLGETILDPACGTGGFLACTIEHLKKQSTTTNDGEVLNNSIYGIEKKPLPHQLCTTNMILHGIDTPINIKRDNTLAKPINNISPSERVDCIVTNPPFGGTEEDGIETNFPASYRTKETADLFLLYIIAKLKPNGRVGIVLPDGALFGEGVKTRIKEKLMEDCNLHTIIRLPKSVFAPYTSINTNLLFFTKCSPTKETWFYRLDMPEGYKNFSKTKPMKKEHFQEVIDWWKNKKEIHIDGFDKAKKYTIQEIKERNYNLDLCGYPYEEEEILPPMELIAKYQEKRTEIDKTIDEILSKIKSMIEVK